MPIVIKQGEMKYKSESQGEFISINTVAEATTSEQVALIEAKGTEKVAAVESKATEKITAIESMGTEKVAAVESKATEKLTAIESKGTEEIAAIEAKGTEVLTSIPNDYTELADDLESLNRALNALEPAATSGDVGKFLKAKTVEDGKVTEYEFGEGGGGSGTVDDELSTTSTNPVQNSVITNTINKLNNDLDMPSLMEWVHTADYMIYTNAASIDVTNPYTLSNRYTGKCSFIECDPGDVFYVSAQGNGTNQRTYAFYSETGAKLSTSENRAYNNERIVAPDNAKYVAFNSAPADQYGIVYVGEYPKKELDDKFTAEVLRLDSEIDKIDSETSEDIHMLEETVDLLDSDRYIETEWENGWINNGNNQNSNSMRRTKLNYKLKAGDIISCSLTTSVTFFNSENIRGSSEKATVDGATGKTIIAGSSLVVTDGMASVYLAFHQSNGTIETSSEMIADGAFIILRKTENPFYRKNEYPYFDHFFETAFKDGDNKIPFYVVQDAYVGDCQVVEGALVGTGYSPSTKSMYEVVNEPYKNPALTIIMDSITKPFRLTPGESYGQNTKVFSTVGAFFYDKNGAYISNTGYIGSIGPSQSQWDRNITMPSNAYYVILHYNHTAKLFLSEPSTYYPNYIAPIIELNTVDNRLEEEKTLQVNADSETNNTVQEVMDADFGVLRFVHVTDTHQGTEMGYARRILFEQMVDVAKKLSCDFIMHTGDIINGATSGLSDPWKSSLLEFKNVFLNAECPVIVSRGNHDDNSSTVHTAEKVLSNAWFNNNIVYTINNRNSAFVKPDNGNGYFYLDFPQKKIRVVNINASDLTEEERITTGGQGYMVISQDQLDWLDDVALNVDEGWKIICCSHVHACRSGPNSGLENSAALRSLLQTHASKILGYFFGHTHTSADFVEDDIRWISVNAGGAGGGGGFATQGYSKASDTAKANSPTDKFLFDVVEVYNDGSIKRYRWGVQDDVKGGATPPVYQNDESEEEQEEP